MSTTLHIVYGGGWKAPFSLRIKLKAWSALLAAVALGLLSLIASKPFWIVCGAGFAVLSLFLSVRLFLRETSREFKVPRRADYDPRNLYVSAGHGGLNRAEPSAPPNGGPAELAADSNTGGGPPSVS